MESMFEKKLRRLSRPPVLTDFLGEGDFADAMPPARLAEYQRRAVRAIVARAYESSPFYRRKMEGAGVKPAAVQAEKGTIGHP